jgi:hypothetical protein
MRELRRHTVTKGAETFLPTVAGDNERWSRRMKGLHRCQKVPSPKGEPPSRQAETTDTGGGLP